MTHLLTETAAEIADLTAWRTLLDNDARRQANESQSTLIDAPE
jgi:hypothetical protein